MDELGLVAGVAGLNLLALLSLLAGIYRVVRELAGKSRSNHTLLVEFVIYSISLASFVFFVARENPIWPVQAQECFWAQTVMMALFELQLSLLTYVQYLRYIRSLRDWTGVPWILGLLLVVFTLTTILNGYTQTVEIGGDLQVSPQNPTPRGTCDFEYDPVVATVTAALHAVAECAFLLYFYVSLGSVSQAAQSPNQVQYRRMLQVIVVIQMVFTAWILCLSGINFADVGMLAMAIAYNCHFTLVMLVTGLPHLFRARGWVVSTIGRTSTANRSTKTLGRERSLTMLTERSDRSAATMGRDKPGTITRATIAREKPMTLVRDRSGSAALLYSPATPATSNRMGTGSPASGVSPAPVTAATKNATRSESSFAPLTLNVEGSQFSLQAVTDAALRDLAEGKT